MLMRMKHLVLNFLKTTTILRVIANKADEVLNRFKGYKVVRSSFTFGRRGFPQHGQHAISNQNNFEKQKKIEVLPTFLNHCNF